VTLTEEDGSLVTEYVLVGVLHGVHVPVRLEYGGEVRVVQSVQLCLKIFFSSQAALHILVR
jgi:hypothetical protein